jgi:hypothetical protein
MPAGIVENEHCQERVCLKNSIAFCLIDRSSFPYSSSHSSSHRRYGIEYFREYLRIQFITTLRVHRFQKRGDGRARTSRTKAGRFGDVVHTIENEPVSKTWRSTKPSLRSTKEFSPLQHLLPPPKS